MMRLRQSLQKDLLFLLSTPKILRFLIGIIKITETILPKVQGSLYFIYDDQKELKYIGRTKKIRLGLRNHLIRKTSNGEHFSSLNIVVDLQNYL